MKLERVVFVFAKECFFIFLFIVDIFLKGKNAALIRPNFGLQSLHRKCRCSKGQEEQASLSVWVYLQKAQRGEGRKRDGKRTQRGRSEETDAEREREGPEGLLGEWDFVHCVKCDRVLEPLEQLGSSPAAGFQLLTFRGDAVAAARPLPRLTLQPPPLPPK